VGIGILSLEVVGDVGGFLPVLLQGRLEPKILETSSGVLSVELGPEGHARVDFFLLHPVRDDQTSGERCAEFRVLDLLTSGEIDEREVIIPENQDVMEGKIVLETGTGVVHGCPGLQTAGHLTQISPVVGDVRDAIGHAAICDRGHVDTMIVAIGGQQLTLTKEIKERRDTTASVVVVDLVGVVDDRRTGVVFVTKGQAVFVILLQDVSVLRGVGSPDALVAGGIGSLLLDSSRDLVEDRLLVDGDRGSELGALPDGDGDVATSTGVRVIGGKSASGDLRLECVLAVVILNLTL